MLPAGPRRSARPSRRKWTVADYAATGDYALTFDLTKTPFTDPAFSNAAVEMHHQFSIRHRYHRAGWPLADARRWLALDWCADLLGEANPSAEADLLIAEMINNPATGIGLVRVAT
jgi:hypothetical protein